jgi:hypothetical protein
VIDAHGKEIAATRRMVPTGFDSARDAKIVDRLRAVMGEGCEILFCPYEAALS